MLRFCARKETFTTVKAAFALSLLLTRFEIPSKAQSQPPQFTISTVAGNGVAGYSGDGGSAISASVNSPGNVALDSAGNLYIGDAINNRVRKVTPDGVITTVAGTGVAGFGGDGGPAAQALLNSPARVLVDAAGNLYIADAMNYRIRKVAPNGTITTFAGNGTSGLNGDGGPATSASIDNVGFMAMDTAGDLFMSCDGTVSAVRKVTPNGIITTVAGASVFGYGGDGGRATAATLNSPKGLAIDSSGNLFIADRDNERIRKVSNGVITTVAGNGTAGYAGDAGQATRAELSSPLGIAFDAAGNLYIADYGNNRVRLMLTDGTINTVAGNGVPGFAGDGGLAVTASLNSPDAVAVSAKGVYVSDGNNERIRLLTPVVQTPAISPGGVVSASAFGGFTSVSPGSWIEIYGSNLASDTRSWGTADFSGVNAPTSLDGTSVAIGGQAAFVDFISPGQVNALVPSNTPTGLQHLTVTTGNGTSAAVNVTVNAVQPGLLAPPSFTVSGTPYAVALFADGSYALPAGAIPGINSRPAKPGDVIVLYGVGFGPVIPALQAGQLVQQANALAASFQIQVGGMAATVLYAGLAPNYSGLYQFNITVPNVAAGNAVPLTFTLGNVTGTQALFIGVQN